MDFDGTISKIDVGDELFRKFGNEEVTNQIINDLIKDQISSRECWTRLCENAGIVNIYEWDKFIDNVEIEESFKLFVQYCNQHSFDLFILSDGFDYYIKRILIRQKLAHLKFFSNSLFISPEGYLVPSFPYFNENCRGSANCKRTHIIEYSGENDYTFYIGDGISDKDPIEYVDFIFAKDDLLKYCEKQRITYYRFKDFNDVIEKLNELKSKKRLKKRHQAELKRREAYTME